MLEAKQAVVYCSRVHLGRIPVVTGKDAKLSLGADDEIVEWDDDVFAHAEISVGGKVVREASGTLTRRGRPPLGDAPKQQVTLRLPRAVIEHFKSEGAGWQTRISEALELHVGRAKQTR